MKFGTQQSQNREQQGVSSTQDVSRGPKHGPEDREEGRMQRQSSSQRKERVESEQEPSFSLPYLEAYGMRMIGYACRERGESRRGREREREHGQV